MKEVVIYSTRGCPYCVVAKRAMERRGLAYREIDITRTPHVRDELHAKTGERTVPQVFVDGIYIGQDDELVAMVEAGDLDDDEPPAAPPAESEADLEVAIVGAGRSGLSLALALADHGRVAVFERGPQMPDPERDRLRADLTARGQMLRPLEVFGIEPGARLHQLVTLEGLVAARHVVVATGARDPDAPVAGESALLGRGASHCAQCDGAFFSGLDVVVAGPDERAMAAALLLAETARQVTLLCPLPSPEARATTVDTLTARANVTLHTEARLHAIRGKMQVTGVTVETPDGRRELPADGVFLYRTGTRPASRFLKDLVETDADGAIRVSADGAASRPGIHAVGTVTGPFRPSITTLSRTLSAALGVP